MKDRWVGCGHGVCYNLRSLLLSVVRRTADSIVLINPFHQEQLLLGMGIMVIFVCAASSLLLSSDWPPNSLTRHS